MQALRLTASNKVVSHDTFYLFGCNNKQCHNMTNLILILPHLILLSYFCSLKIAFMLCSPDKMFVMNGPLVEITRTEQCHP